MTKVVLPEMNRQLLPSRALVDTGVLTRALDDATPDPLVPLCRAFWLAMIENGNDILIAAPSLSEIIRKDVKRSVPRNRFVEVVDFDQVAAEILGKQMPMDVLKEVQTATGTTLTHLKYDALIVACAARHNADCIVAIDPHLEKLAPSVGLVSHHPDKYRTPTLFDLMDESS